MPEKYGLQWPDRNPPITALEVELLCFKNNHRRERGGLGPYMHFKNACNIIWKDLKWNDWMSWGLKNLCEHSTNAWTGCGAAGKTYLVGLYGFIFWLADPTRTSVILVSTTGKMVRRRIWPVIQELYNSAANLGIGNLVDSKTTLQASKGDDKHGIFAIAVKEGPVASAVAEIQGMHSERMFIDIDEATDVPEAMFEAIPNLRKGCKNFRLGVTGNASSHLDPHGQCCEPKDGWNSINVDSDEWETKGVPRWEIDPGIALHFDGTKSPNVRCGQDKWPFLFTNSDLKRALANAGAEESVGFWKFTRGFWAPEGVLKTIMSEGLIEKHDGRGKFTFFSKSRPVAGLDPAFGGDKCVLRIGRIGDLSGGRLAVQLDKLHYIAVKANKNKQVIYDQIVEQVVKLLTDADIPPEAFGMDATGQGGMLAATFVRDWSSNFLMVEFGGAPSDTPTSDDDPRPANEIYDRRVTELWFTAQNFLVNGQLKGLFTEECIQFCNREFSDKKRKMVLDTKEEYKLKNGHSPDEADSVVVLLATAKHLGALPSGGGKVNQANDWNRIAMEKDEINVNDPETVLVGDSDPFALNDF